jgi:TRAP-type C4-dicarboxylate transport system substrate-binding protein
MQSLHLTRKFLVMILAAFLLPATASAEKTLRYSNHEPLGGMRTKFIKDVFFAAIEKESNGRLKIADHWDSALATGYDALTVLGEGTVADIGIVVPEYKSDKLPLHQISKASPWAPPGIIRLNSFAACMRKFRLSSRAREK